MLKIKTCRLIKGAVGSLFLLLLLAGTGFAATKAAPAPQIKQVPPPPTSQPLPEVADDDPYGRSTPQGTVLGFLRAMDREDFERAVEYFDTKQPPGRAEQLAQQLHYVLNKKLSGDLSSLSHKPEGDIGDGLRPDREKVGVVETSAGETDILLERVKKGDEPSIWLFASDTLRRLPDIYDEVKAGAVERRLPSVLVKTRVFHLPLWRWIAFLVMVPVFFIMAWIVTYALTPLLRPLARRLFKNDDKRTVERTRNPFRLVIFALVIYAYSSLSYSALARLFWMRVAETLLVISLTWLCVRLINLLMERTERMWHQSPSSGRIAVGRLLGQVGKGLAIITGVAMILYHAGINLTAVLTGLGVGGIAIAFAAQKTLENLFGGIMIISDQTIRVGDFCRVGEHTGVVENIGLRSTRIRTFDRSVVSVPNGQLSTMSLENFATRDKIKFNHTVDLQYGTSGEVLRKVVEDIRRLLNESSGIEQGSSRVRLVSLRNSSFQVEVFAYVMTTSLEAFLEVQEQMLLSIIDAVEANGASLATPPSTPYMVRQPGGGEQEQNSAKAQRKSKQERLFDRS